MKDNGFFNLKSHLGTLEPANWREALRQIAEPEGMFQSLGEAHLATFIEGSDTLFVTFETEDAIRALAPRAQPLGFGAVRARGWAHLSVVSHGETWFRDPAVYDFFDKLSDAEFFDSFERVIFFGAGSCGYAAAAFSVVAPGASVIAVQPQATLDPQIAGWDTRFPHARRRSFAGRYGYAPDMLTGAAAVHVIYDPQERADAIHAALFRGPNIMHLRMPGMGGALQKDLMAMNLLFRLFGRVAGGGLTTQGWARMMRARRDHIPYLRRLLSRLESRERLGLSEQLCRSVVARLGDPKFAHRLSQIEKLREDRLVSGAERFARNTLARGWREEAQSAGF